MTTPAVIARTATVYKGGGRTYITKAGAYKRAAVMLIHAKPQEPHEDPDFDEYGRQTSPSCTCSRCMFGSAEQKKLIKRLARWLRWRDELAAALERAVPMLPEEKADRPWNWCHKCRQTVDVDADSSDGSEHLCWGCNRWLVLVVFDEETCGLYSQDQLRRMSSTKRVRAVVDALRTGDIREPLTDITGCDV